MEKRIIELLKLFHRIMEKDDAVNAIKDNQELISQTIPSDIIALVDKLVIAGIPNDKLKIGINKFINVLYKTIKEHPYIEPDENSFLDCCIKNNVELDKRLKALRPQIIQLNKTTNDKLLRQDIVNNLIGLLEYDKYYQIKENVLFPFLEKQWKEYRCLNVMWSFHDDIRNNLKTLISILPGNEYDIKEFNKLVGEVFFNMYAIIFREERILFPFIIETIPENALESLFNDSIEIGFPYIQQKDVGTMKTENNINYEGIDLKSGNLSVEQIILLFNHLPVDITFVDEHDRVKYFSTPKKRIFPRTNAIIGREVKNCHPPDSVHIVEEIISAFRTGEKDKASFWIKMKGEYILIQYFAIRDDSGNYKGVLEVSQEISEIKNIEGEKRLLEWGEG